ncbi:MAG: ferritin-like domain-containing protein [candidate division KSB1 bacterium]|nr:ferritin-like domain-containing protein [candidate division KSB1 bacterium]MDQ7062767.1 ferritin-like domain-containing protein [candidate division KSB1 bacterium]
MSNKQAIIDKLIDAYWKELETVQNYLALSVNLDGIQAKEIKEALAADIDAELGHAKELARRIKELGGVVPGSKAFKAEQSYLQTPQDTTNILAVINGVLEAEEDAIQTYSEIIKLADGQDYVTQDLAIRLLADEEAHREEFTSFLREFKK